MRMRYAVILAVSFAAMAQARAQATQATARPISLTDAVRLAQRNSPATVQARGQIASGGAALRSAYGAFLPNINVSASAARSGGDRFNTAGQLVPLAGEPWQYNDGISANVELFSGFRRFSELRAAKADIASAEANETLQEFNIALNVKQQYYNVLAARESESAARSQLEQAEQQLRAAAARVAQGAATKSDSLRSVIQVGNARLALLTAQNNLRVGNASLTRLIGSSDLVTAIDDTTQLSISLAAVDSAQLAAWAEDGPAVRQARASLTAANAASRTARAPYLPTLNLSFSRSGSGFDNRFGYGDKRYSYGDNLRFSVSYPLFNGFAREEQVTRTRVQEDIAFAQLRDARLAAQQQFVQHLGTLRLADERVQIQRASVEAAEEDLRVQQQRYALGASTLLDLLTSQLTLNQARAALIQARYDARVARAQIEALIGREIR
ncbi:MAG TPA: TolC family protein [Gemmatimonadaceae bacterium]|nr:TolC family protein [Gemmatimonadaceae bacterium]